jgi:FkbM family methyltransferase
MRGKAPFWHLREAFRRRRLSQVGVLFRLAGLWQTFSFLSQRLLNLPLTSVQLREIAFPLYLRPGTSDWTALRHVLEERDCDVALVQEPRLIVDGGANVGFASVLFANKYPRARILAVEPHRDNAVIMRLNCLGYPYVELINSAIWSYNACLEIANPDSPIHGGFQVRETTSLRNPNTFHGITVTELLHRTDEQEIDLLKLDIEGAEAEIFSHGYHDWIRRIKTLVIECHGESAEKIVRKAMAEAGSFRCFQRGEKLVFQREA